MLKWVQLSSDIALKNVLQKGDYTLYTTTIHLPMAPEFMDTCSTQSFTRTVFHNLFSPAVHPKLSKTHDGTPQNIAS
jgi:hypothetical protein